MVKNFVTPAPTETTVSSTPRFVVAEEFVAIHDTERNLYYQIVSNKSAYVFAKEFNDVPEVYADIINDLNDWTADPVPQESND